MITLSYAEWVYIREPDTFSPALDHEQIRAFLRNKAQQKAQQTQ